LIYVFGDYSLAPERRELRRGTQLIVVEPRVFDLLEYLIRNRDQVVSKDDLIDAVWNGRIVSESALVSRMSAARDAVGDSGEEQRLIRTIARKGYRFVGEVLEEEPLNAPHTAASVLAVPNKPAVAVLPFENMSGDQEQDYFADGLTEDLTTALSLWRSFPVIARNSTHTYKGKSLDVREIGRELNARYVITGSVRRAANRVRVTAELIDSENGHHLWAERYNRDVADIFMLQDELSQQIAATVAPELDYSQLPAPRTSIPQSLDAWELVQRGYGQVFAFELGRIKRGREYFERAIEVDAGYARAYTGLAWSYHRELWLDRPNSADELTGRLVDTAARAVSLDKFDAEAHTILAMACNWSLEIDRALLEAERAVELNPNSAAAHAILGHVLVLVGRPLEAIPRIERAVCLSPRDPRHGVWMSTVGLAYLTARKYEDAAFWLARAIQRHRENPDAQIVLASSLGHLGRIEEAHIALDTYKRLLPNAQATLVWPHKHEVDSKHFRDGLRKAGWADDEAGPARFEPTAPRPL
jgi:TolB-like protein/tetratricopeptide (TPR) repeat protein